MRLLGVVLAGGRSSRFGSDKALAVYCGRSFLDGAIAALAPLVAEIAVCGRAHGRLRAIADRPAPGLGPLGGLNGALAVALAEGFDAVLSVPCDVPLLDADTLRLLIAPDERPYAFADLPVCGMWPASLACLLDGRLRSGAPRSAKSWVAACAAAVVPGPGLANVNAPEDLARLPR